MTNRFEGMQGIIEKWRIRCWRNSPNDTVHFIVGIPLYDLTCLVSFVPSFLATGTRLCTLILFDIGKDPSNVDIFQSVPGVVIFDKVSCMMELL